MTWSEPAKYGTHERRTIKTRPTHQSFAFRHLEYFVAAAEELNFTHAAGRLHVSQPPFSKQIRDLQGEVGIELFERRRKGVALTVCRRVGFKPRIVKEADGAASALAFVAAGFGVAVVSEPLQKIPAKDVICRELAPEERAWVPVGAAWKPDGVFAPIVSQFVDVLARTCARGNGRGLVSRSN